MTYGQTQLVPDFVETIKLPLHLCLALLPEAFALCLLERYGSRLLKRADTRETDASVRCSNVLDQMLGSNQVSHSPTGCVEQLASAANCQSKICDLRAKRRNASERHVVELIVDFVGKNEDVVLDAEVANGLQLLAGEHFADGVVRCVDNNHTCALRDLAFQLFHVECPLAGRCGLCGAVLRRMQRHVDDLAAGHLDVGDVLVEEGFEDNHLITGLEEAHEG